MQMRMSNLSHKSVNQNNHNLSGTYKNKYKQYQSTYQPDVLNEEDNDLQEDDKILNVGEICNDYDAIEQRKTESGQINKSKHLTKHRNKSEQNLNRSTSQNSEEGEEGTDDEDGEEEYDEQDDWYEENKDENNDQPNAKEGVVKSDESDSEDKTDEDHDGDADQNAGMDPDMMQGHNYQQQAYDE